MAEIQPPEAQLNGGLAPPMISAENVSTRGLRTGPVVNLGGGDVGAGMEYHETLEGDGREGNLEGVVLGSWKVRVAKSSKRGYAKRFRSNWISKGDDWGEGDEKFSGRDDDMDDSYRDFNAEGSVKSALPSPDSPPNIDSVSLARALIVNPSTSEATASLVIETLAPFLQSSCNSLSLRHTLCCLSDIAINFPCLSRRVFEVVRSFSLSCSEDSPRILAQTLSVLVLMSESIEALTCDLSELTESLFLSLCFQHCVTVRHWLLLNAERLSVRPHLLLTTFLGFSNDPYPYVRQAALDGQVHLCKSIVVEDLSIIQASYFRSAELLNDMEDSVRSAAIRAVCYAIFTTDSYEHPV